MTNTNIEHEYFQWLCEKITPNHCDFQHESLLSILNDIDFVIPIGIPDIINDDNRASNGINLRWHYVCDGGSRDILDIDKPCSVLELLIAVAKGVDIDLNKTYSKDELKLLLDNFDIVILDEILEKIDYCDFVRETIEHFPIENAYTHLAKFIKANINKECIMQDIVSYYNELIEHIHDVIVICKKMNREELVAEIKESIAEFLTCSSLKRP